MRNHIFIPRNKESHLLMSWASQEGMFLEFHPNNKQPKMRVYFLEDKQFLRFSLHMHIKHALQVSNPIACSTEHKPVFHV